MATMNYPDRVVARLTGWRLGLSWLAWAMVFLLTLAVLAYLVPANYGLTYVEWVVETARPAAERFMAYEAYVALIVALETLAAAVAVGVALLVAALRPTDRMGLITSAFLLAMGPFLISTNTEVWRFPVWLDLPRILISGYTSLLLLGILAFFYLFPDGRLQFKWLGWFLAPIAAFAASYLLRAPLGISALWFSEYGWAIGVILLLVALVAGLTAQLLHYRRLAPVARQQIKWVLLGLSAPLMVMLATFAGQFLFGDEPWMMLVSSLLEITFWLLLPVTIGISMLRYHLWDVDVIIRRTLIYAALTGTLLFAYMLSILLLQYLFRALTQQESPLAVVVSTLLIAALFTPLRRRIQDWIDRRFFRRKYDAQQVLAQFALTARNETDLDSLTAELARVVGETMQPERVGVWLRKQKAPMSALASSGPTEQRS